VAVLALAGCRQATEPEADPTPTASPTVEANPVDPSAPAVEQALAVIPLDATTATVTDWDAIRARLGVPDLTSEDLMTDRLEFWRRAEAEAVLLTDGALRDEGSTLELDYGFTQDDVDWEVRWTGPESSGLALGLRPDLPLDGVRRAVADGVGPLAGATIEGHVLEVGGTDDAWSTDPGLADLVAAEAPESTWLHRDCVPLVEALGPDATQEDLDALLAEHDVADLADLPAVAVTFADDTATAWLGADRDDLAERADLAGDWPWEVVSWKDAFRGMDVADPVTGRIGLQVKNPRAAATLTLGAQLPFATCNEVVPIPEPTGL
jgi:hypothetical protein